MHVRQFISLRVEARAHRNYGRFGAKVISTFVLEAIQITCRLLVLRCIKIKLFIMNIIFVKERLASLKDI